MRRGVTLIEITIVITILPLIITAFILVLDKTLGDAKTVAAQSTYDITSSLAIDRMEDDVRASTAFNSSVSAPYSDPYQPVAGWNYVGTGSTDRVMILSLPATTVRENATTRSVAYQDSATYDCATQLTLNPIMTYRAIYFVNNATLYKRFLTDTTTPTCATQIQKQTCPSASIASWPSICKARDEVIAEDVLAFSVDYHQDRSADALPNQYTDTGALSIARAATITLKIGKITNSKSTTSTQTLRIVRMN
jgi:prepilin-type N-terminal cleavage/methylation domain-containing protein